jgi:hypothetical protein
MKTLLRLALAAFYAWAILGLVALWVDLLPGGSGWLIPKIIGTVIVVFVLASPLLLMWDAKRTQRKDNP